MNQQCKVCGEPAAGFHFGAFTCEGCKSFFGRTYNNVASISECKNNGDCVINKKNRTSCKSCRLMKCLRVGMSKSGSRYGRRSNWFKIHCLLQEQNNAASTKSHLGPHLFGGSSVFFPGFLPMPEKLLTPSQINSYRDQDPKTRNPGERLKHDNLSEDSVGSSADVLEDDFSRSTSAPSVFRPPSSQQPSSPFSEKDFLHPLGQRKVSTALMFPTSPAFRSSTSSLLPPTLFPYRPISAPPLGRFLCSDAFPIARPGTSLCTDANSLPFRTELLCSPETAGDVAEQEQPIDLSVKNCSSRCSTSPVTKLQDVEKNQSLDNSTRTCKEGVTPLDLTNKTSSEIP